MAGKPNKQGGRTTAKGTQPVAKKPRTQMAPSGSSGGGGVTAGSGGGGGKGKAPRVDASAAQPVVNRQMRRAGFGVEDQSGAQESQKKRLKLVLGGAGAVLLILTIVGIVLFGISGTWIGVLLAAAGVGVGFAVSSARTFLADRGTEAAIGIVAIGVIVCAVAATGLVNIHFPGFALFGAGVGAFFAYVSAQQMIAPPDPPAAAQVLLRRNGAQLLEMPGTGNCIWATPDGRMRVIVGAQLPEGTTADEVPKHKVVIKSRQQAAVLMRRVAPGGVESTITCVVDISVPTVREGDTTICSVSSLTKVLARPAS